MQIFENISPIITKIGPTQILSILLLKFGPHKYFSYYYQNWTTKLYQSIPIYLVSKTQKAQPIYYKAHCYTTPIIKLVVTRYLGIFTKLHKPQKSHQNHPQNGITTQQVIEHHITWC